MAASFGTAVFYILFPQSTQAAVALLDLQDHRSARLGPLRFLDGRGYFQTTRASLF
jgi:hypothetical protein